MNRSVPIYVRQMTTADEAFLWSLASDERVVRWVGDGQPWTRDYFNKRIELALQDDWPRQGSARWFIATDRDGVRVALLTITRTAGGAEIGYWVAPDHWGQGIAGGVIDAAVTLTQGLDLVGRTHPDNGASRHVLQRAEFVETSRGELITYSRAGQITPAAVST
jgi:RimJ/RimL family protein N-acetyltransferase